MMRKEEAFVKYDNYKGSVSKNFQNSKQIKENNKVFMYLTDTHLELSPIIDKLARHLQEQNSCNKLL